MRLASRIDCMSVCIMNVLATYYLSALPLGHASTHQSVGIRFLLELRGAAGIYS